MLGCRGWGWGEQRAICLFLLQAPAWYLPLASCSRCARAAAHRGPGLGARRGQATGPLWDEPLSLTTWQAVDLVLRQATRSQSLLLAQEGHSLWQLCPQTHTQQLANAALMLPRRAIRLPSDELGQHPGSDTICPASHATAAHYCIPITAVCPAVGGRLHRSSEGRKVVAYI